MSFFGNLFGGDSGPVTLDKYESFIGILLSVMAADGHISAEEVDDFYSTLRKVKFFNDVTQGQFREKSNKVLKVLRTDGPEKLVELSAQHLPDEYKQATFAYACDMVFSDGTADKAEQELLDKVKGALGIDDALAYKVAEVLIIKNKL